jgi:hypothetical protein
MPHAYSPTAKVRNSAAPIPDGPVGSAATWKELLDARNLLYNASVAIFDWSGDLAVSGSAANNFSVEIGAINALALYDGTDYRVVASGGDTITQTSIEGGGGTLGAAVDWWYVYVYRSAGTTTVAYEISQTAPGPSRAFKSGDSTRRYLGCFRTNTSGVPLAVRASRGTYVYRTHQQVLASGTATSKSDVIVRPTGTTEEALIPNHARLVECQVRLNRGTDGTTKTATIYGAAASAELTMQVAGEDVSGAARSTYATGLVETDSSRQIAYALDSSAGGASLDVWVRGWRE